MSKLSDEEKEVLYDLIEEVTGTCQRGQFKKDVLLSNVERRMGALGISSFNAYLFKLSSDDIEFDHFISLTTIHTTFWFRENPHFEIIEEEVMARLSKSSGYLSFSFWTSACSTGQEAYSIALVMEKVFKRYPRFSYEIFASDIDNLSVAKAKTGKFSTIELKTIPSEYHQFLEIKEGFFTIKEHIKRKMTFFQTSLLDDQSERFRSNLDFIFCRNVLIYFDQKDALNVIRNFEKYLADSSLLILGHSENFDVKGSNFSRKNNSTFRLEKKEDLRPVLPPQEILKNFSSPQIIVIGASTGGPETLERFLRSFPRPCPPIVVIQHINSNFSESFARRLSSIANLDCIDTTKKAPLKQNSLYMPLGDYHLQLTEEQGEYFIQPNSGPLRNGHRASVDVLFESVARTHLRSIGVLLTGMGRDGAEGLLKMKRSNRSLTMAQNKESSVVFGMPREAIALDAAHLIGSDKYLSQCVRDFSQNKFLNRKAS
jgi:chemotaxis protein methyltransferase CheR